MKKVIVLLVVALFANAEINAQEFNKWSVDLGVGVHKPVFPISSGYRTDTPDFWQANIGGRYMLNEKFGIRADFGYNKFTEGDNSNPFSTKYFRGTLEAVVNAGNLLNFKSWTKRLNVLVHGGAGLSDIYADEPIDRGRDRTINLLVGITPQFKITDRVALFVDASAIGHFYQNVAFAGTGTTKRRGINGGIFNASIGLNIYLGKNKVHADWYNAPEKEETNELEILENRLKSAEAEVARLAKLKNTKIDFDKKGLISELDNRYSKKGTKVAPVVTKVDFIRELLNKGYQNVYFDFGKSTIQKHSLEAVNYLFKYMSENPSSRAELVGYADELGGTQSNQTLSNKRAKRVYDVLVALGISSDRLTYNGRGEDASVDKNSEEARQLVRRVTFTVK